MFSTIILLLLPRMGDLDDSRSDLENVSKYIVNLKY